jgi:glucose-6-phosphate isomerase
MSFSSPFVDPTSGFQLDLSGLDLDAAAVDALAPKLSAAHEQMKLLEQGAIKNPDEGRQVTHFTDRLTYTESELFAQVEDFAAKVRSGELTVSGNKVEYVVINGIGGSALGPQHLQFAVHGPYWNELAERNGYPRIYFLDNTDSAGLADILAAVDLAQLLVVTISKSGATQETKNNMVAFEQAFAAAGVEFSGHAAAVTMDGSELARYAEENHWLARFSMAESIGGRTSETNIVGHVPAALTGIDFAGFVQGAKHMDELTRAPELTQNPAYQLAAAWYLVGNGRGDRNMVIVPYSDRLVLFGKYLQQLVMESLGKELDLDGNVVHQGLTVFGNKGGTDAHAYIQQLNDGRDDFFVTFIEVLKDAKHVSIANGISMSDYLHGFKCGLVKALRSKKRKVIEICAESLDESTLGMLIALYERAVAVYAELININAFHQPGVQAYKLASQGITNLNLALQKWLVGPEAAAWKGTAASIAELLGQPEEAKDVDGLLAKFALNNREFAGRTITRAWTGTEWTYSIDK